MKTLSQPSVISPSILILGLLAALVFRPGRIRQNDPARLDALRCACPRNLLGKLSC